MIPRTKPITRWPIVIEIAKITLAAIESVANSRREVSVDGSLAETSGSDRDFELAVAM